MSSQVSTGFHLPGSPLAPPDLTKLQMLDFCQGNNQPLALTVWLSNYLMVNQPTYTLVFLLNSFLSTFPHPGPHDSPCPIPASLLCPDSLPWTLTLLYVLLPKSVKACLWNQPWCFTPTKSSPTMIHFQPSVCCSIEPSVEIIIGAEICPMLGFMHPKGPVIPKIDFYCCNWHAHVCCQLHHL